MPARVVPKMPGMEPACVERLGSAKVVLDAVQPALELCLWLLIVEVEHVALLDWLPAVHQVTARRDASCFLLGDVGLANPARAFVVGHDMLLSPARDNHCCRRRLG